MVNEIEVNMTSIEGIGRVFWMVIHSLDKDSAKRNYSFRNSEWSPEAAEALARRLAFSR
jgi:hypothetical protein